MTGVDWASLAAAATPPPPPPVDRWHVTLSRDEVDAIRACVQAGWVNIPPHLIVVAHALADRLEKETR